VARGRRRAAGRAHLVADPALQADPVNGAFIAGLAYAEATQFVDEPAQRNVMLDAYNRVLLEGMDPAESIAIAAARTRPCSTASLRLIAATPPARASAPPRPRGARAPPRPRSPTVIDVPDA
jgi:hypothetical protein